MTAALEFPKKQALRQEVIDFIVKIVGAIRIPAGTAARRCSKCPELIYDVKNPTTGKLRPVSIEQYKNNPPGIAPTLELDGVGISHFANCPAAAEFRSKK